MRVNSMGTARKCEEQGCQGGEITRRTQYRSKAALSDLKVCPLRYLGPPSVRNVLLFPLRSLGPPPACLVVAVRESGASQSLAPHSTTRSVRTDITRTVHGLCTDEPRSRFTEHQRFTPPHRPNLSSRFPPPPLRISGYGLSPCR